MNKKKPTSTVGHPIDVASGSVYITQPDIYVASRRPLELARYYSTTNDTIGAFGRGWSFTFGATLRQDLEGFIFTTESGAEHVLDDAESPSNPHRVADRSSFVELDIDGDHCSLTKWDSLEPSPSRYQFQRLPGTDLWRLGRIQMVPGRWFDLEWNHLSLGAIIDPRSGRRLKFEYNSDGFVESLWIQARGDHRQLARYWYDSRGCLTQATDAGSVVCAYRYDDKYRLVTENTRDGESYSFVYDSQGRCIETSGNANYDSQRLIYFETERRTQVTDSAGATWNYQFGEDGQVVQLTSPLGYTRYFEYDEYGRTVAEVNPAGATTQYRYDEAGHCCAIIDALGAAEEMVYSGDHCLILYKNRVGLVWTWNYDSFHRVIAQSDPGGATWHYNYSQRGDLVEVIDPQQGHRTLRYTGQGDLASVTDFGGETRSFEYDAEGALVAEVDGAGVLTTIERDVYGNPTKIAIADVTVCRLRFDSQRNITERIDSAGSLWTYSYASGARLTEIRKPGGSTIRFSWTTLPGRLRQIVNEAEQSFTVDYDLDGRPVREQGFDGEERRFHYDSGGNLGAIEYVDGRTEYARDPLGRVLRIAHPDGEEVTYRYDAEGRMVWAANPDATVTHQYDSLGRLEREQVNDKWIEYAYDIAGNRVHRQTSFGHKTDYTLAPGGRIGEIAFNDSETPSRTWKTIVGYDAAGRVGEYRFTGGVVGRWSFDRASRPHALQVSRGSHQILGTNYSWNGMDRAESRTGVDGQVTRFSYDPDGRLVALYHPDGQIQQRLYDAAGNLRISDPRPGASNALSGEREFDRHGRLAVASAGGVQQKYEWSYGGRLKEVLTADGKRVRYAYDALGRRISKQVDNELTEFLWDADRVVHEISARKPPTTWLFLPDTFTPLAKVENGQCWNIVSDYLGTPIAALGQNGSIEWAGNLDAYGNCEESVYKTECPWRWPGQYEDQETGLYYNRFRYYDPVFGSYISKDPLGPISGFNPWEYPANPLCWMDPLGLIQLIQAPWDTNPLSQGYKDYVKGLSANDLAAAGGRNIAVARLNDGTVVGAISQGPGQHSERLLVERYGAANISAMYTERRPCTGRNDCNGLLSQRLGKDVPVYYTHENVKGQEGKTSSEIQKQRRLCRA